ncbi:MAG: AraC family transcriptional regulator, partial [Bacteroidia bacterium]|nr:AraC family transcriptional regulator [Bacteroidia bacterium]
RILLSDNKYNHISIEGIGQMVGFVSRSVFYQNFKNLTGITPSYFRESITRPS